MNKLREHIVAAQTNNKYFKPSPYIKIEKNYGELIANERAEHVCEYRIEAKIGLRARCDSKEIEQTADKVRKLICEEIFGEFRPIILEIKRNLYEHNLDEIDNGLNKLLERMFGDAT